jgi:gluconolactonase
MRGVVARTGAAVVLALLGAAPAYAVPDCPSPPKAKVLLEDQGRLESIIGDARGRLFYTDLTDNRLMRLDGPGQKPRVLAEDMKRPGGLVWEPGGKLIAGFSGGATSGVPGSAGAGLFRVDPETGAKKAFVTGIDQANGLARARDGSLYTSNDISNEIVRVRPNGTVQRHWADVESANGLAINRAGKALFAAQTFTPRRSRGFRSRTPPAPRRSTRRRRRTSPRASTGSRAMPRIACTRRPTAVARSGG